MTALTTEQQRRLEALNNAAALLVDRSITSAGLFSKGTGESMKADGMLASDATAAIEMAQYIVGGLDLPDSRVVFDEDGTRIQRMGEA